MPSPFPGMDPYLEPHWLDVHARIVTYAADALGEQLPTDLIASTEERIAIEGEDDRLLGPDVRIFEPPADSPVAVEECDSGSASLKYRLLAQVEPITEHFIKIIAAGTERLITVIEFVSPTNKKGEGLHDFRSKRAALMASGVNFVEMDLVRAGDWRALLKPHRTTRGASLYRATIRLPCDPAAVHLEPIHLCDRLPDLPIPLRQRDPKVVLSLQPLLDRAYTNGRYSIRLDYRRPLDPPLEGGDAVFAEQVLQKIRQK